MGQDTSLSGRQLHVVEIALAVIKQMTEQIWTDQSRLQETYRMGVSKSDQDPMIVTFARGDHEVSIEINFDSGGPSVLVTDMASGRVYGADVYRYGLFDYRLLNWSLLS